MEEEYSVAWGQATALIGIDLLPILIAEDDELPEDGEKDRNLNDQVDVDQEAMEVDADDDELRDMKCIPVKLSEVAIEEAELPPIAGPKDGHFLLQSESNPVLLQHDPMDMESDDEKDNNGEDSKSFTFSDDSSENMSESDPNTMSDASGDIDIHLLASILERGKEATSQIDKDSDVVLVLGGTGVGKSTFIQAVAGQKMIRIYDNSLRKSAYIVEGNGVEGFEIGHGLQSMTRHVRCYLRQSTSTYYVDTSGFGDTYGIETDIATSICIREIAERAGKLRFVVLVNAFQFYTDRSTELRKNLDIAAKFIGHNFQDHKLSFTFLFTHCNEAFSDVRNLIESSQSAESIRETMRANIVQLLGETKRSTSDLSTLELIKFLRKSLEKKYPFCDVFDPINSNLPDIRCNVELFSTEGCTQYIKEPSKIVKCSLTPTAKMRLDQEVNRRKRNISSKLIDGQFDEGLGEDVLAIRALCSRITSLSMEVIEELTVNLETALTNLKDQVFGIVQKSGFWGVDDACRGRFSLEMARNAKRHFDSIGFMSELINKCKGRNLSNEDKRESEELNQLKNLLNEQATLIENEVAKMSGFLYSRGEECPDISLVARKLENLRIWVSVFQGDSAIRLDRTELILQEAFDVLFELFDLDTNDVPKSSEGVSLLRGATLLKKTYLSGLFEGPTLDSFNRIYANVITRAKIVVELLLIDVRKVAFKAFCESPPVVSESFGRHGQQLVNADLANMMVLAENMHVLIMDEAIRSDLGGPDPSRKVVAFLNNAFSQRVKVCLELMSRLDEERASIIRTCSMSLGVFFNSITPSAVTEGIFLQGFKQLRLKLESQISIISENVSRRSQELELNGMDGNINIHLADIRTLQAMKWFDAQDDYWFAPIEGGDESTISQIVDNAINRYVSHTDVLCSKLQEALGIIFKENERIDIVQNYVPRFVDACHELRKIAYFSEFISSIVVEAVKQVANQISSWCQEKSKINFPGLATDLDVDQVNVDLIVARGLHEADISFQKPLAQYVSLIESKLEEYSDDILATMIIPTNLEKKSKLLQKSIEWSTYTSLTSLLPIYDNLRLTVNNEFSKRATELDQIVKYRSSEVDMKVVGDKLQFICDFVAILGGHLDPSNISWKILLEEAVGRRRIECDTRFNGYLEDNDYEAMKIYLEKLMDQGHDDQHRSCLRGLSMNLMKSIDSTRVIVDPSTYSSHSEYSYNDISNVLKTLETAEKVLGTVVEVMPPTSSSSTPWTLHGISNILREEISTAICQSSKLTATAVHKVDFGKAVVCMTHCQSLCRVVPNNKNNKAVTEATCEVEKLFDQMDYCITEFLASFTWCESDKIHKFPPDVVILRKSLSNMKETMQIRSQQCPSKIQEGYHNAKQRLSDGLAEIFQSLKDGWEAGQFERSIKVLSFLGQELDRRCLREHLDCTFDVGEALAKVNMLKIQARQAFRSATLDKTSIDEIAIKLDRQSKSSSWFSWFGKNDYDYNRNLTTKRVKELLSETLAIISSKTFAGLRQRLLNLQYIEKKIGTHLLVPRDMQASILPTLTTALNSLNQSTRNALKHRTFGHFENTLFPIFREMTLEIIWDIPQEPGLFLACSNACKNSTVYLNRVLYEYADENLKKLTAAIQVFNNTEIPIQVERLNDLGFFLVGPFELFRQRHYNNVMNLGFEKLLTVIHEEFGKDKLIEISTSLAILELGPSANLRDVTKAYRRLSLRYHPDKNPGDENATEKFTQIKNASDILKKEGNLELRRSYDFFFLVRSVNNIPKCLAAYTRRAMNDRDYQAVDDLLVKVEDTRNIARLVKEPARANSITTLRNGIEKVTKQHAHSLTIDIKKAYSAQDFVQLHHSYADLEEFETAFKAYKNIIETSLTATILEELKTELDKLNSEASFLRGVSESSASKAMDEFATKLIKIGRILDGFPKLKKQTTATIHHLLNGLDNEPWGVSFIFKLGLLLEKGELSGNDDDKRIGRVIVGSFPHFKDVRTVVFNREVITADVRDSVSKTKTQRCTDGAILKDVKLDRSALKNGCDRYEELFNSFFSEYVQQGHDELVIKVFSLVQQVRSCTSSDWNDSVKSKVTEILAGVSATFTIIKSGDSFRRFKENSESEEIDSDSTVASSVLFRPHNIQIIAILRLLGIGTSEKALPNHIMEVRTGEGKSVILGALAVVLSLLGFTVRCVCYSEHLSERDNELFGDIFASFGVATRIKYSKITTMSEDSVAEKGDIRELTVDLINGKMSRKPRHHSPLHATKDDGTNVSSRTRTRRVANADPHMPEVKETTSIIPTNKSKRKKVSSPTNSEIPAATKSESLVEVARSSGRNDSPLPLNGEEILLVDEVDVFFGPDFYGKTYNQVAELEHPLVEKLMRKIWDLRSSKPSFSTVSKWSEFDDVKKWFKMWSLQIKTEVKRMCSDVQNFNDPPYEVDVINTRLGYRNKDSVDWDQTFGYRTGFAYVFELENGRLNGASTKKTLVCKALRLRISCSQFSYAHIEPTIILGVSGTLRALSKEERSIVNGYGVNTYSFVPSVYGPNNLSFDKTDRGIAVETEKGRHLQEIANTMKQAINQGRSAIAFFENDDRLIEFQKSSHWRQFRHANVLSSTTDKETRKYIINKAATTKQVTIATAVFGRGTDFFCKDSSLESAGGMLVVQTFLSVEKSEELQMQGRTARQGKKGSYCMVLIESELTEKFGIIPGKCHSIPRGELYIYLDGCRQKVHGESLLETQRSVIKAEERDALSRSYLNAVIVGDKRIATRCLTDLYQSIEEDMRSLNFCRLVCLSDATGSMGGVWNATRLHIQEMLNRINEIGKGRFELLWIAYRDYSESSILEKSKWSKNPKDLSEFVSSITCNGGGDYEEAVELALNEANNEHDKNPITRVLLIADAPPHYERCGEKLGGHNHVLSTDYRKETLRLKENGIPVYTFRLGHETRLVRTFKYIADETGGESQFLDINAGGSKVLMDCVCENALEDIGGSELVAEYRARHGS
jgi:hypothetical protein